MLITFAGHSDNRDTERSADRFLPLTRYMDAPVVMKDLGQAPEPVFRSPRPEVLSGRAETLRRTLATLPFERKYTSLVLSFAAEDLDCAAFNAGEPRLRGQVDLALQLVLDLAYAGIPASARPPHYITTHTHTGRLELNLALIRAVYRPDGRMMSHNSHPPGDALRSLGQWFAVQDLLNHRFGWSDPGDPARRRIFSPPDLVSKRRAELTRARIESDQDWRLRLVAAIESALEAGQIRTGAEALAHLRPRLEAEGLGILGQRPGQLTVGGAGAPPSERLRLRGALFDEGFRLQAPSPEDQARRRAVLETAPERVLAAWSRRAAYNHARYSHGAWPEPEWDLDDWSAADPSHVRRLIPARHHLSSPALHDMEIPDASTAEPHRAPPSRPGRTDRPAAGHPDRGPRSPGRGTRGPQRRAGSEAGDAGSGGERLLRLARQLSGPLGRAARLNRLALRLLPLSASLGPRLALARIGQALTAPVMARLAHIATRMELINDDSNHEHRTAVAGPGANDARAGTPAAGDALGPAEPGRERQDPDRGADRGGRSNDSESGAHDGAVRTALPADGQAGSGTDGAFEADVGIGSEPRPPGPQHERARKPDRRTSRAARQLSSTPCLADLLRAGEAILQRLPLENAQLRFIPKGVRFEAPHLCLDLMRDRIVLQRMVGLSHAYHPLLRDLVGDLAVELGFAAPDPDATARPLVAGEVIAAHPDIIDQTAAGGSELSPPQQVIEEQNEENDEMGFSR